MTDRGLFVEIQADVRLAEKELKKFMDLKRVLNIDIDIPGLDDLHKQLNDLSTKFENVIAQRKALESAGSDTGAIQAQTEALEHMAKQEADLLADREKMMAEFAAMKQQIMDEQIQMLEKLAAVETENAALSAQLIEQQASDFQNLHEGMRSEVTQTINEIQGSVEVIAEAFVAAGLAKGVKELVKVLWDAVDAAIKFESSLALIEKTTFSTTSAMSELRNEILSMSTEIPLTVAEISSIVEEAGRLGIEGTENIIKFSRTMALLGATTTMTAHEAARSIAGFAAVVGLPINEVDRLGSALSLLGNNVAVNEGEIMRFAHRTGSAGAAAGLTAYEILGLSAALAHLQLPAEMGGSAISRLLQEITLAVETSNANLENFARVAGKSAEEFSRSWREDVSGTLIYFLAELDNYERHGASVIQLLDEIGIRNLRIADTMRRAALSGEHLNDIMKLSAQAFEANSSLQREAEIRFSTTESQMQLMANATNQLKISIGDALTPALNQMAGATTEATLSATQFIEQNQVLVQTIAVVATMLSTMVGTMAAYTAGVKLLTVAKTALGAAFGVATTGVKGFSAALLLSPAGKIILALTALAGIITTVAMATGAANQRQEENRRIAEENAAAHRESTKALKDYMTAFDELNNRRLQTRGAEETRAVNEDILSIQHQIREAIGAQGRELDLVNGGYAEQRQMLQDILLERRRLELEDARSAMLLAQGSTPTIDRARTDFWGRTERQLGRAGVWNTLSQEDFAVSQIGVAGLLNSMDGESQIALLREWQPLLNDAALAGENVSQALSFVQASTLPILNLWV